MSRYPHSLEMLILKLKQLPGVGQKSAERFAFHLIDMERSKAEEIGKSISFAHSKLTPCKTCGCLSEESLCFICSSLKRDFKKICIVSHFKEIYPLEETGEWSGTYHVLGGLLSPLDRMGPEELNLKTLYTRIEKEGVEEILIALDATLEGDATALFLKRELARYPLKMSRLAFGIPVGSALDLIDSGTLSKALSGRSGF